MRQLFSFCQYACFMLLSVLMLTACSHPYQTAPMREHTVAGLAFGEYTGMLGGTLLQSMPLPFAAGVGSAIGMTIGFHFDQPPGIIHLLRVEGIQVVNVGDITTIYLPTDRIFKPDSTTIRRSAYKIMTNVAKISRYYDPTPVLIDGHTDDVFSAPYDRRLALDQARSVTAYLWAMGVHEARLRPQSFGSSEPIATNHTFLGSYENRRIEVTINRMIRPESALKVREIKTFEK